MNLFLRQLEHNHHTDLFHLLVIWDEPLTMVSMVNVSSQHTDGLD